MKSCVVIPARYKSSRFPGKPLAKILGKEMILHVAEASEKAINRNNIFILTDDERIRKIVLENNFNCLITSNNARTGTDRIAEVINDLNYEYFINVQGDEPLVNPSDITKCIELKIKNPSIVVNGFAPITNWEDFYSTNIPKVLVDKQNYLIYMSRSPVPGFKSISKSLSGLKRQVCIYGYNKNDLNFIKTTQKKGFLEEREDIEILRFIENGRKVLMYECDSSSISVDVPNDIEKIIGAFKS
tara:strand:- start:124 stop:852 length:729 start_codon:yes stop_codon:yes gene_type:complete